MKSHDQFAKKYYLNPKIVIMCYTGSRPLKERPEGRGALWDLLCFKPTEQRFFIIRLNFFKFFFNF